jgi:hypothetical protein
VLVLLDVLVDVELVVPGTLVDVVDGPLLHVQSSKHVPPPQSPSTSHDSEIGTSSSRAPSWP